MTPGAGDPDAGSSLLELREVMRRLRAECGWKAAQTHRSLARHLLEETHETLDVLAGDPVDDADLAEELGDLLLQVYFHAAIAEQEGRFTIEYVASGIVAKLLRRNPHVFGPDAGAADRPTDPADVNALWESVKATEKQRDSLLDGIPSTLPALLLATKVLDRLERAGQPAVVGPRLLLVPSPFLGAATWERAASSLRARGRDVVVVRLGERTPEAVVEAVEAQAGDDPVVVVTHSNAGLYAPLLTTRLDVVATVHVDAALPAGPGPCPLVPDDLAALLGGRTDDQGFLPPWTAWWEPADLAALAPPDELAVLRADEPRVPSTYLSASVVVPDGWTDAPSAYLALGGTYAEERARAASYGWPVRTLGGGHLAVLTDAPRVAGAIVSAVDDLVGPVDVAGRLLAVVADARREGADPEQELRSLARGLAEHVSGTVAPTVEGRRS